MNAIVLQGFNQNLHRTGDFPLGIGILYPQKQHAAALMGHPLGGKSLHQIAQMDKAGGGGCHPGDNCPFRDIAGGIFGFQLLTGHGDIRKQQLGQCVKIHSNYLFLFD